MQLNLFSSLDPRRHTGFQVHDARGGDRAWEPICWTRMQAEAGQPLSSIILRKERERSIGNGTFFWGIGSALGKETINQLGSEEAIRVVFSTMLSRPKAQDTSPSKVALWRSFVGLDGSIHDLPPHALVISKAHSPRGAKTHHYALVCSSTEPLEIRDRGSFDPSAYRNVGGNNGRIGHSQVTALVHRVDEEKNGRYAVDMEAELRFPFFIKLANPKILSNSQRNRIERWDGETNRDWMAFLSELRR